MGREILKCSAFWHVDYRMRDSLSGLENTFVFLQRLPTASRLHWQLHTLSDSLSKGCTWALGGFHGHGRGRAGGMSGYFLRHLMAGLTPSEPE